MKVEYADKMKRDSGKLRFGVLQLPNLPWNEMVKRYLHLEELGFDIAGTGDHSLIGPTLLIPGSNSGHFYPNSSKD